MYDGNLKIPSFSGQNLAPLNPLIKLRDTKEVQTDTLTEAIKERFNHYHKYEDTTWREILSVAQLVKLFMEGKQLLARNPYTLAWRPIPIVREDASTQKSINIMDFYGRSALSNWMQSQPDIRVRSERDADEGLVKAKGATAIIDHYEEKFFDIWYEVQTGLAALQAGLYITEIRYDAGAKGDVILREIFEDREISLSDGYAKCGDCETAGGVSDFLPQMTDTEADEMPMPQCPSCGSDAVMVHEQPVKEIVPMVAGQEQVQMGDLCCTHHPLATWRWDLTKRLEESAWAIHRTQSSLAALYAMFGKVKLPEGNNTDWGLDMIHSLAYSGTAISGASAGMTRDKKSSLYKEPCTIDEFYLSAEDLAEINIREDEQTVSGIPLKAGNMAENYPNGLCFIGVNGMSALFGVYEETHRDYIVTGQYSPQSMSGLGRGLNDTVEVQRRFNKSDSRHLAYMETTDSPAIMYHESLLGSDKMRYLGHPRTNIPVDLNELPNGMRLSDAIWQFQPNSVPGYALQYTQEFLIQMAQYTSGVTQFSEGLGADNKTATGARIGYELANAMFITQGSIKADARKRLAAKIIELYRKHFPYDKQFLIKDKYGHSQSVMVAQADIESDFFFSVSKGSEMPNSDMITRLDMGSLFEQTGGFMGFIQAMQMSPRIMNQVARKWGLDFEEEFDAVIQVCLRRLNQLKEAANVVQNPFLLAGQLTIDPMTMTPAIINGVINPPLSVREMKLKEKGEWFQEWLDYDEAMDAPPQLRMAVEMVIDHHLQFAGYQAGVMAQVAGAAQMMGTAPQQEADDARERENADRERQGKESERQSQSQEADKERSFAREESMIAQQHERELSNDKMKAGAK